MGEVFDPLDPSAISGLAALWGEVGAAIGRVWDKCNNAVNANTAWTGPRADRFHKWWDDTACIGINDLDCDAMQVSFALQSLYEGLTGARNDLDDAASLVRSATQNRSEIKTAIRGVLADPPSGGYGQSEVYLGTDGMWVRALAIGTDVPANFWPSSIKQAQSLFESAMRKYDRAMSDAATSLNACKADVDRIGSMLPHVDSTTGRVDGLGAGNQGLGLEADDPLWAKLAGPGVFKPTAPNQFEGYTTSGSGLPEWYDPEKPSTGEKIVGWLDKAGLPLEIGAVAAAIMQPEAAPWLADLFGGLYIADRTGQAFTEVAMGDEGAAALDGLDIVLAKVGTQDVAKLLVEKAGLTEHGQEVTAEITKFAQGRVIEELQTNALGEAVLPLFKAEEIMSELRGKAAIVALENTNADQQLNG